MAYVIRAYLDICWVPEGSGMATLGQNQSNNPGIGASGTAGIAPNAQTLRLQDDEAVPGGSAPSSANFNTALIAMATSFGTQITTAGAYGGNAATPLAIAQGWATGNP